MIGSEPAVVTVTWGDLPPFRLELHERTDLFITNDIRRFGVWEPFETLVVSSFLRPGGTFIDIGANIGWYAVVGGLKVGQRGRVIAFEPDPLNFLLLGRNVAANGLFQVELVNKAAWDCDGRGELFLSETNLGDHRLYPAAEKRHAIGIDTITLDTFFGANPPPVDLIKMDCQGAEARILAGAKRTLAHLANATRTPLVMEFWPHGLMGAGCDPKALTAELEGLEMSAYLIEEGRRELVPITWSDLRARAASDLRPETQSFVNILALPKERPLPALTVS